MVFTGEAINGYVLVTLKAGLKLYAKTGMKPNRALTPSAMLAKATEFTGKKYKRGAYLEAVADLQQVYEAYLDRIATDGAADTKP